MVCPACSAENAALAERCGRCDALLKAPQPAWAGPASPEPAAGSGTIVLQPGAWTAGGTLPGGFDHTGPFGGGTLVSPLSPDAPGVPPSTGSEDITRDHTPTGMQQPAVAPGARGPLEIGSQFGARYRIVKLLGVGGMGAVYQAWDAELGVTVALKVVRPEVAADPATARDLERRFKRELLLARQVTHANVVRIHDLGEIDGIKYITMPFIEGEDLATILKREGVLPPARAIRVMRTMLAGLLAAHKAGVVHRDLKPANVMITADDQAMIMDFGIARSSGRPEGEPGSASRSPLEPPTGVRGETRLGSVVGTIEYMAPEQARGEPVDERADIYAFGLICYDMLVGRQRHERAASAFNELLGRMSAPPPAPRSLNPEVPVPIDRLITKCLQPDLAARYQSTAELVAALDRLDDKGKRIPLVRRLTPRLMVAAALTVAALVTGTYFLAQRLVRPPAQHDPVSVLIADFDNRANDSSFKGTLEPMLKMALEGAGFISAYDRSGIRSNLGVRPPERLDERAALELAVRQGVGVVLSGAVERRGTGYSVAVKATQAVSGVVITSVNGRASGKDQVLGVATELAGRVRKALGDDTSGSSQLFAMESLSATSLDIVRDYAAAMEALSNSRFEEALRAYSEIVARDPTFGLGYLGMAVSLRNLDRHQESQKYMQEALRHLDSMTERERLRTRGLAFKWAGDYQACVKEFGDLLGRYASDAMAHNNLAGCQSYLRDLPKAIEGMRQAVKILPKRNLFRENLALYAAYGSDFLTAEREARAIENPGLFGVLPLAFSQVLQGQVAEATETYRRLSAVDDEEGPSYTASGLGDLGIYQGRFAEAERILEKGALADLAGKNPDRAAAKYAALGHSLALRGAKGQAVAAASKALANSQAVKIRFLAARVFVEAGETPRATPLIAGLAAELQAEPQAYAKILEGEVALKSGKPRDAIKVLGEANSLFDTWIGHFVLGRAYLEAGAFMQADSEFDRCLKRRGEAVSLFLDEEPTYGFLPPVYYYQGRAREGLNSEKYAESYRAYLAIRGGSKEDPLVPDARRRAGN